MSEEERKGAIEIIRTLYGVHRSEDYQKAFDVIIAALSAELCEDAISRQAAIDAVAFGITYATGVNMETGEVSYPFAESNQELRKAIHRICELPLVTPKQRTGHWIEEDRYIDRYDDTIEILQCSICRFKHHYCQGDTSLTDYTQFKYCPNCGARMEEQA